MYPSDALRTPNRISFHDELNAEQRTIQRDAHLSERALRDFTESLGALTAAITLMALGSLTESFAFALAIVARHFGLAFFGPVEPE